MGIVLFIIGLILVISVYFSNISATKERNCILLGITLPYKERKNKDVLEIVNLYKKANKKLILLSVIILIPAIVITYASFQLLFLFLWVIGLICRSNRIFNKYNRMLMKMKRERNWLMGNKYLITIDTEVSRMKNKMPVSKWWFIPSVLISIIPIIIAISNKDIWETSMIITSLTSMICTIFFIILHKMYSLQKTEVYSDDSKINLACNTIYKRYWTLGLIIASTLQSITLAFMFYFMMMTFTNGLLISLVVIVPASIIGVGIFYIGTRVKREQNELISKCSNLIYTDWDEYWKNDVYNNPNDYSIMVEKRVGYGMTFNMGSKKGRMGAYLSYGFAISIVLFLTVQLFIFDFSKFTLVVSGDLVKVSAPQYGTDFNIEDIEEIELIDDIPSGMRTNAIGTERYSLGHYSINGYGKALLYVYSENPPYIKIKLKDKYIFINGDDAKETESYYNELKKSISKFGHIGYWKF